MKSYKFLILFKLITSMLISCYAYTKIQIPLDNDYDVTELGTKIGRASNYAVLYLFAWGDAGSKAAAENGGIKVIRLADREVFSIIQK